MAKPTASKPKTGEQLPELPVNPEAPVEEQLPGGESPASAPSQDGAPAPGEQPEDADAPAAPAAPAAPPVESAPVPSELDDAIPGLWIRSVPPTFRRCGFAFTRDGMGIALHALTEEQVEVLVSEPNLVVEHTVFTDKVRS